MARAPSAFTLEDRMGISIAKHGGRVVAGIPDQLTVGNRQELKQKVLDEVGRGERKFLVDFSGTGYIDSAGLGVLVSLAKQIRAQGGELRIASLNDDLKTLFELTKLDALFQLGDEDDPAGRPAPLRPRPPGPLEGAAEAEWPDPGAAT